MILLRLFSVLFYLTVLGHTASCIPPVPPPGYRWVLNEQFSDEFNGTMLDRSKWNDTFGDWEGRPPALFIPEAISIKNGKLEIKSGILDQPYENYTIYGGAVSSSTYDAHYGYYECSARASKIAMSTTFWMSNQKVPFTYSNCDSDSYSQELDIQEAVGGGTTEQKFRDGMNCNTHFRYIKCGASKEEFISRGTGTKLRSHVSDEFHTYGAWWVNANEVIFFADNQVFDTIMIRTDISQKPFDRPMKINMVTETYNWQPPPSHEDLLNDSINTAYYDWVRSYILVPVHELVDKSFTAIFDEGIAISNIRLNEYQDQKLKFDYIFKSNTDENITFQIIENGKVLQSKTSTVLAGFGNASETMTLSFDIEKGKHYALVVSCKNSNLQSKSSLKIDL